MCRYTLGIYITVFDKFAVINLCKKKTCIQVVIRRKKSVTVSLCTCENPSALFIFLPCDIHLQHLHLKTKTKLTTELQQFMQS